MEKQCCDCFYCKFEVDNKFFCVGKKEFIESFETCEHWKDVIEED